MHADAPGTMTWGIEEVDGFVLVRTHGHFNAADHRAMVIDILRQPFWRPGRNALFDHRSVSFDDVDYATMAEAVNTHRAHDAEIGDGRAAILMQNKADFGLGRLFEGVAGESVGARLHVFVSEHDARAWLTRPPHPAG